MYTKQLFTSSIIALAAASISAPSFAQNQIDEIIVTARKTAESLQEVPVTVTAVSSETLERFSIDNTNELDSFVPNLQISQGGPAAGATVRIRGIGSSINSAAFDTAVAFNIDGVQSNNPRALFAGLFDMEQIEVLKGPQSLYFGKSASAGVITMSSKGPTDEFEAGLLANYEFEERTKMFQGYISGPISDTLGARLAFRINDTDRLSQNTAGPHNIGASSGNFQIAPGFIVPQFLAPGSRTPVNEWRGEEGIDGRLTLDWEPTDRLRAQFKGLISRHENDGALTFMDVACAVPGQPQISSIQINTAITFPTDLDCDARDGVIQVGDVPDVFLLGIDERFNNGVPFDVNDTDLYSLTVDYDLTDTLTFTSVTGFTKIENLGLETFTWDNNAGAVALAENNRDSFTQEFRLASNFGGRFDFAAGLFYQDRNLLFDTRQMPLGGPFLFGPDPVTGNTWDWQLIFDTDSEAWSGFTNLIFRPSETVEITAGARYSDETYDGTFDLPYIHALLAPPNFLPIGTSIDNLTFEDDNISPEVTISWQAQDNVNLFAAYKTGFKSGGLDSGSLPTATFSVATAQDLLAFDSETAEGFELGIKSDLLDNSLRFNATAFFYTYEDLQTQQFDPSIFNVQTSNAGELKSNGFELETLWAPSVEGLTLSGALAYTDTKFTEDFFAAGTNGAQENLNGLAFQNTSKWAGNAGAFYETPISDSLLMDLSLFANYRSSYRTGLASAAPVQGGVVKLDSSVGISTLNGRWKLSLIGNNLTDKRTYGNVFTNKVGALPPNPGDALDQALTFSRGRQVALQLQWTY